MNCRRPAIISKNWVSPFDVAGLAAEKEELEKKMGAPDFWDDVEAANKANQRMKTISAKLEKYNRLRGLLEDAEVMADMAEEGDVLIALPSSGVHSNGFSLVRKVFNIDADPDVLFSTPAELGGKTLGEALLAPTKIYVKPVLKVLEEVDVKGISHITGGGFYENIPRSLKKGCCARIKKEDVRIPALFHLMQETGGISEHDMFNTFNMGVGMVLTVPAEQADKALEILHANGEPEAYRLGVIAEGEGVELC